LDRGLDDEVGRAEIGLADAEIDDVAALRRQRIGTRQHRKGVFLPDAVEGGNGFQHGMTFRCEWRVALSRIDLKHFICIGCITTPGTRCAPPPQRGGGGGGGARSWTLTPHPTPLPIGRGSRPSSAPALIPSRRNPLQHSRLAIPYFHLPPSRPA